MKVLVLMTVLLIALASCDYPVRGKLSHGLHNINLGHHGSKLGPRGVLGGKLNSYKQQPGHKKKSRRGHGFGKLFRGNGKHQRGGRRKGHRGGRGFNLGGAYPSKFFCVQTFKDKHYSHKTKLISQRF